MDSQPHGFWIIVLTIVVALLLSIVALDGALVWARPNILLLVLFYWMIVLPERVGLFSAWCAGLMLDILQGGIIGQNAFSLIIIAYITQVSYQRVRMFSIRKQAVLAALFALFYVLIEQWARNLNAISYFHWRLFLPVLTTGLLWLIFRPAMTIVQRLFEVR